MPIKPELASHYRSLIAQDCFDKFFSKAQKDLNLENILLKNDLQNLLKKALEHQGGGAADLIPEIDNINSREDFDRILNHVDLGTLEQIDRSYLCGKNGITTSPFLEFEGTALSPTNTSILQDYLQATDLSVVVSLSQGDSVPCVAGLKSMDVNATFNIQSVGKIMTGVLAIKMLQSGILSESKLHEKVELDEDILSLLPAELQEKIKDVTLHQLMTHKSGLKDYFGAYIAEISSALDGKGEMPIIEKPEDFIRFADKEIAAIPAGEIKYSNLAILLVGLAIQTAYNKAHPADEPLGFDAILKKHVLDPARVTQFSKHMPPGSCLNERDLTAPHLAAGPDGGQWTNLESLNNFGKWFCEEWHSPKIGETPSFKELVTSYGQEFYNSDKSLVEHNGTSPSSSAFLSIFPETNTVFAALSNKRFDAIVTHDLVMKQLQAECSTRLATVDRADISTANLVEQSFIQRFPSKKQENIKTASEAEDIGVAKKSWREKISETGVSKDDSQIR